MRDPLTPAESRRMVRTVVDEWKSGKYSKISIIYNHYVSAISQIPTVKILFPISGDDIFAFLEKYA
jgi:F0F1-type ATP synthase gamma subunit